MIPSEDAQGRVLASHKYRGEKLMVFAWVSAWFPLSFAGFVQFSICGRFSEVSAGFLGCNAKAGEKLS